MDIQSVEQSEAEISGRKIADVLKEGSLKESALSEAVMTVIVGGQVFSSAVTNKADSDVEKLMEIADAVN